MSGRVTAPLHSETPDVQQDDTPGALQGGALAALQAEVERAGHAFVRAPALRALITAGGRSALADWDAFAASWDRLVLDPYMADGGRYRRRRHAVLTAAPGSDAPALAPRQPHYQSVDYNALNGGIERWYQPVEPAALAGSTLRSVLAFACRFFAPLRPGAGWKLELHQFRIEASAAHAGLPTPEGLHRDGVDCVLVLLVRRENVSSGTTTVHHPAGRLLGSFTLTDPLDAALVDDARVLHGVTQVEVIDESRPAFRDVLVATFLRV